MKPPKKCGNGKSLKFIKKPAVKLRERVETFEETEKEQRVRLKDLGLDRPLSKPEE